MTNSFRKERDLLGELDVPAGSLHGIHSERALQNFPLSGRKIHPELVKAYGAVKLACLKTNIALGFWEDLANKADAMEHACREMWSGDLTEHICADALQGGAGTSTNMNVNEVLANRALQKLGKAPGDYSFVSPTDDLNLHQSTNDTYPTALKLAAINLIRDLDRKIVALQESFQALEKKFSHIVKVGRTQYQDAVLTTLGREMGAYAEALSRDRWRVYKCEERLRVVNLGGTAIGSGFTAPRQYIFRVTHQLRELTGVGFARAENMTDATQNADVFVEVSGILKACAATLIKISGDLRFMASGPEAGIGEIALPARQAGSSVMPGKVNPVIPEAVTQAALLVIANDSAVTSAASLGHLELNAFLPLVADRLLESITLLANGCDIFRRNCVDGIQADEKICRRHVEGSTCVLTALLPLIGYKKASELAAQTKNESKTVRELCLEAGLIKSDEQFNELISAEAVCRLGSPTIPEKL